MPQETIRSLDEELLTRMVASIPPRRIIPDLAKIDRRVYFRYFKGYRPDKISRKKMLGVVRKEIIEGDNVPLAELLVIAWNASNWDCYDAMRRNVAKVNPVVEEIEKIEDDVAEEIIAELIEEFEPEDIYLCSVLNEVRFTPEFKARLTPQGLQKKPAETPSGAPAEKDDAPEAPREAAADSEDAPEAEGDA